MIPVGLASSEGIPVCKQGLRHAGGHISGASRGRAGLGKWKGQRARGSSSHDELTNASKCSPAAHGLEVPQRIERIESCTKSRIKRCVDSSCEGSGEAADSIEPDSNSDMQSFCCTLAEAKSVQDTLASSTLTPSSKTVEDGWLMSPEWTGIASESGCFARLTSHRLQERRLSLTPHGQSPGMIKRDTGLFRDCKQRGSRWESQSCGY
jgi:hypothetical protein